MLKDLHTPLTKEKVLTFTVYWQIKFIVQTKMSIYNTNTIQIQIFFFLQDGKLQFSKNIKIT